MVVKASTWFPTCDELQFLVNDTVTVEYNMFGWMFKEMIRQNVLLDILVRSRCNRSTISHPLQCLLSRSTELGIHHQHRTSHILDFASSSHLWFTKHKHTQNMRSTVNGNWGSNEKNGINYIITITIITACDCWCRLQNGQCCCVYQGKLQDF